MFLILEPRHYTVFFSSKNKHFFLLLLLLQLRLLCYAREKVVSKVNCMRLRNSLLGLFSFFLSFLVSFTNRIVYCFFFCNWLSARLLTWLIDWLRASVCVCVFMFFCLSTAECWLSLFVLQLPLTARIMEWLQLQPISRFQSAQESGFVEEDQDQAQEDDDDQPSYVAMRNHLMRRSLPTSVRTSRTRFGRRWKFLSRKSSWRSL